MFRNIYQVEVFTGAGDLKVRRFAANKKVAEKISREYTGDVYINKLLKSEHDFVCESDVER